MSAAEKFAAWVLAAERTIEEAFAAELLVDQGIEAWKNKHRVEDPNRYNFELRREGWRRRQLNPAHRRVWAEEEVMRAAEFVPGFTKIDHSTYGADRPLRDLSVLRFCPQLVHLQVAPTELENLEALRYTPALEDLWVQDNLIEDLSALRLCPGLKKVHLWLGFPWCDLRALAELPELESLILHGNLGMLDGVGPLPKVTHILLKGWGHGHAPIRDGHALPDMPGLKDGEISPVARLAGFEKFAACEDLIVEGPFKDLKPLAALSAMNKLTIGGEHYGDLGPIARMQTLAVLRIAREFPLDYTPLLDSASLREVQRCNDKPLTPEQAGINAALGGWDNACLMAAPRPLPEPVFRLFQYLNPADGFDSPKGQRLVPCPKPTAEAQGKWLAARLEKSMSRKFGRDWGETYSSDHDAYRGKVDVRIHDIEIADRLSEVVQLLREQLAWLIDRWVIDLTVDPKSQWQKNPEAWKDPIQEEMEEQIEEARSYAERRRDYLAFLERLQRYRLREEQGEAPPAGEFAAPPPEKMEEEDSDLLEPPTAGVDEDWEAEDHPSWHDYYATMSVSEEGVWAPVGYYKKAERLLLRAVEKFPGFTSKDEEE